MDLEKATKTLEEWDDICSDFGLIHYLIYGTALGFYRDGGFIPWDNDIDTRVVCSREQWDTLIGRMKDCGFNSRTEEGYGYAKNQTLICIEHSPWAGKIQFNNNIIHNVIPVYHFDIVEFNGSKYNVPHPIEEYLSTRYGDWKKPEKNWDKHSAGGY